MKGSIAVALLLALLAPACASRRIFAYEPTGPYGVDGPVPYGVVVPVFSDLRGQVLLNHNLKNFALIPLVPVAFSYRDSPERTPLDDSDNLNGFVPGVDLAKALASEVQRQRIFDRCRFSEIRSHGERFELRGRIRDFHVSEGYLTYGISFVSIGLHLLGFPEGTLRTVLSLEFELVDRRQAKVVWTREATASRTRPTWIYDSSEADHVCAQLSDIAREILPEVVRDLGRGVRTSLEALPEPSGAEPPASQGRFETTTQSWERARTATRRPS